MNIHTHVSTLCTDACTPDNHVGGAPAPGMEPTEDDVFPGWNAEMPSRAVIASDGHGNGCILWDVGFWLENEMDQIGTRVLEDLGLDDAPIGISIWEGRYVYRNTNNPLDPPDFDSEAAGEFREPTAEEWKQISEKQAPWDESEWYDKTDQLESLDRRTGDFLDLFDPHPDAKE